MRVVDLGCGLGGHFTEFVKTGGLHFPDDREIGIIQPKDCLGVDKQSRFQGDVEGQGFNFMCMDVTEDQALMELPDADYYLVWDFLHHLPDQNWVAGIVQTAIHRARKGVWIRMLSFEDDMMTGEGRLKALGLRFAWSKWPVTKTLMVDMLSIINEYKMQTSRNSVAAKPKPGDRVRATGDPNVVPENAAATVKKYDLTAQGPKVEERFDPPLVAKWEIIVTG